MIIEILMPALSPTMTDGTLAKWHKKEGDKVKAGDLVAEIETDKATMEVEAVDEGFLGKILINCGTHNVKVGEPIALIIESDEDKAGLSSYKPKTAIHENIKKEETQSQTSKIEQQANINPHHKAQERIFASPLAKRIAEQKNINLSTVKGTGPHGRIIKSDVESFSGSYQLAKSAPAFYVEPLTNMRRVIAKRLVESKQNVPHFYLNIECNLDKLLKAREEINSSGEYKISVNDFIIKASSMALAKSPNTNSSWSEDGILRYNNVDISVAVAIEGGLVTPIIKNADEKSLLEISQEMKILAARAKEGKLRPEEYQGGNFSISNLGMYGIESFSAIINPPQSCILAVGAGCKKPTIIDDKIVVSTIAKMTLSCDHRVVDGAVGAEFLRYFKDYIENPFKMLFEENVNVRKI